MGMAAHDEEGSGEPRRRVEASSSHGEAVGELGDGSSSSASRGGVAMEERGELGSAAVGNGKEGAEGRCALRQGSGGRSVAKMFGAEYLARGGLRHPRVVAAEQQQPQAAGGSSHDVRCHRERQGGDGVRTFAA
jgi:hypothetical protein